MTEFVKVKMELETSDRAGQAKGARQVQETLADLDPSNIEGIVLVVKVREGVGPQGQDVVTGMIGEPKMIAHLIEHATVQLVSMVMDDEKDD